MIPRRRLFGVVAAVLLVGAAMTVAATTASGMSASPALAAATATYTDPAGDSQGGPDVTTVAISGDAVTGAITFSVTVTGYAVTSPTGLEHEVKAWLDTDRNRATGDPLDGTDYGLMSWVDSTGRWWNVSRWNGSKWELVPESATQSFTRRHSAREDILTWTVNASELGGAAGFRFYVLAGIWSPAADDFTAEDDAPDSGWWDYSLTGTTPAPPTPVAPATKVKLMISAPKMTPGQAVAGKRFTVSFPVQFEKEKQVTSISVATGEVTTGTMIMWTPVPSGKMVCDPSVAGKVIAHAESFKSGQARLSFVIPKTAKGKLLKVQVKITATDAESGKTMTAAKVATFRVR